MKRLIYQVYVGKKSALYDHCTDSVAAYCKEYDIDHVIQRSPKLMIRPDPFSSNRSKEAVERLGYLPIYEKENAFDYLKTYDQVAIVDSDIWIRPGAPNIFDDLEPEYDFGGVVEREMPITQQYAQKIINYSNMQYGNLSQWCDFKQNELGFEFINMGLMVMNKSLLPYLKGMSPKEFITQGDFKQFVDGIGAYKWSTDQTLLNYWIKRDNIKVKNMDWKWNGLFSAITKPTEAYFVHFFLKDKLPEQGENVVELMKHV
tara:strand:+ start:316 stop:1092 length:777 start_codon:yes stop_codon:yes gene_type:complete